MNKQPKKLETIRTDAKEIFRSCLTAVDPYEAVKRFVHVEGDRLVIGMEGQSETEFDLTEFDRISLVGAGKATAPMARAIEKLFGEKIQKGLINLKYGFTEELAFTEIIEAGHPVPDENGVKGTIKILDFFAKRRRKGPDFFSYIRRWVRSAPPACRKYHSFGKAGNHTGFTGMRSRY